MGKSSLQPPAPPIYKCAACFTVVNDADIHCTACGYPLKGTAIDQTAFIANHKNLNVDFVNYSKAIKKAGRTLFYLSAIFAISGIYNFFVSKDDPDVILIVVPLIVLAITFLLLGEFSKKKPLACIIVGIGLYGIVQILDLIGDPASIARGIFGRVVIIILLINGLESALDVEKIKKEHHIQ